MAFTTSDSEALGVLDLRGALRLVVSACCAFRIRPMQEADMS